MSIGRFVLLSHRRKSFVMIIAIAILAIISAALFDRVRTRSDIIRKQEIEREAISKGAEEHMKRLRGNPSEMAKKAFGVKDESAKDKDKKTKSPGKETRKDEQK